jgi:pyrroloquinoline quinone biosynthesis protein D
MVDGECRLKLPRHIKLRHDPGRGRWIILAPERVFNPDETAVEVLKLCDGQRSVRDIAEILSQQYQAPLEVVTTDIVDMLQDLTDKGVLTRA